MKTIYSFFDVGCVTYTTNSNADFEPVEDEWWVMESYSRASWRLYKGNEEQKKFRTLSGALRALVAAK